MATHFAVSPQEDDAIIKQRLLTRTTVTRGEPPIKKLTKKFLHLSSEVFQEDSTQAECQKLARLFLHELSAFQQPLQLTRSSISADEREQQHYRDLHGELQNQIAQAESRISDLKVRLESARRERQHQEECEVIRQQIAAQPSRQQTMAEIAELESGVESLEKDNVAAGRLLELRRKQFALLLHTVDELQASLEEDPTEDKAIGGALQPSAGRPGRDGNRQGGDDNMGNVGLGSPDRTAGKGGPTSMDVDAPSS